MKKVLALCLTSLALLASCGSNVSATDFVKHVQEKNANLKRTEYNTVEISGSFTADGQQIMLSKGSPCYVTWINGIPDITAKSPTDYVGLLLQNAVIPFATLTNELASNLASIKGDSFTTNYSLYGFSAEGTGDKSTGSAGLNWNDELLLTRFYSNNIFDIGGMSINITCEWKNA